MVYFIRYKLEVYSGNDFEIFELDIIGTAGRIRVLEGGRVIEFYSIEDSKFYKNYKNLHLSKVHTDSIDYFMKQGLSDIINSKKMPSLQEDLYTQKVIDKILHQ